MPIFKRISNILDHRTYNGAALVGLDGVVFKSHGSADEFAFTHAIKRAAYAVENDLNGKIRAAIIGEQSCRKKIFLSCLRDRGVSSREPVTNQDLVNRLRNSMLKLRMNG